MEEKGKLRLSFDFTREALEDLEKMQKATRSPNKAEVVRKALSLYAVILSELREGDM